MTYGTGRYQSEDIDVKFQCRMQQDDFGVPHSPKWWTPIDSTIEIESLEILGVAVSEKSLPKGLVDAIIELSSAIDEWEIDA